MGATFAVGIQVCHHRFNPRAREGRDFGKLLRAPAVDEFQSTRPRGARPAQTCWPVAQYQGFNPRAREGRDARCGARHDRAGRFNPRAREGRDRITTRPLRMRRCFNPRAREGRDAAKAPPCSTLFWFQSTRPRGARRRVGRLVSTGKVVSIHAPARGATI